MHNPSLAIEALLFVKTEPLAKKKIAQLLKITEKQVEEALSELKTSLSGRGIRLLEKGDEVMLGTAPETSEIVEAVLKEEISRDLGRAGLETISIILYKGPLTKNEIDFIRGVNSQFILRNLLVRGLVERIPNPDGRGALYRATFDLLRFMGVEFVEKLPNYESVQNELKNFKPSSKDEDNGEVPEVPPEAIK